MSNLGESQPIATSSLGSPPPKNPWCNSVLALDLERLSMPDGICPAAPLNSDVTGNRDRCVSSARREALMQLQIPMVILDYFGQWSPSD